ncbi:HD-GYP domain-containing protein [Clostridium tyrobutyricum]|uniref:HD-GYP domain-containing protein n=1 Tax=Clostridium tyrobutyricum TaxID=1519 RepID=UPI001C38C105|nr:HD-GYP domain-containing protein [Clostridium tyrobutyricum]MBV4420277.1 HD-GYP domain-containing protein [Clostridium tyrobutyricum]
MRMEHISKIREGQVLGKSILTSDGQILLKAGVNLSGIYINKLRNLGVCYIYIEDEMLDDVYVEDEKLTQLKQSAMKSMSSIVGKLYDCNGKGFEKAIAPVQDMMDYILNMGDVNKSLYDIKTYDNYTSIHSLDTCVMSCFLAMTSGVDSCDLREVGVGAILHDVGKTKVPIEILNKKAKLTYEEFEEIKKHPIYGVELLKKNLTISNRIIKVVEQHHERIDGRGYPYGLKDKQITKFAKIVCICDVYDAVSNDRVYRKKFKLNESYELILSGSGSAFDKQLVLNFKNTFAIYPLGCHVNLSNNEDGYIIKQNKGFPDRPVVRVIENSDNISCFHEIDLLYNTNIVILGII